MGVVVGVDRCKGLNKVDTLRDQQQQEAHEAHDLMVDTTS